jgi:ribose 5-phosphate isomerase A
LSKNDPFAAGKAAAGALAAASVSPGMKLGLGTGSTVAFFLDSLANRVREGELPGIIGVPTSIWTQERATQLGIPLGTLEEVGSLDLTVDGADDVDSALELIKGLGGALLREKMVAQATDKLIIIVDESKLVQKLGARSPLPVEVVPFAWQSHLPHLTRLGAEPILRIGPEGSPVSTDNGNLILDCRFPHGIDDPPALEAELAGRAGVVESGLFLGMANEVLVGGAEGVQRLFRDN